MSQQVSALPLSLSLEGGQRLIAALFEASNVSLPAPVAQLASGLLGLNALGEIYCQVQDSLSAEELAQRTLQTLDITVEADFSAIPKEGPLLLVSNHPFGMLEGLVLMAHLAKARPDVRILANNILDRMASLAELKVLAERLVPIDVAEGAGAANNLPGLRASLRHLEKGGAVVVFPAGTVSHWQRGQGVCDPRWHTTALRLSEKSKAPVVPIFFEGRNSLAFNLAGLVNPALRTFLLPRQLLNKRGSTVTVRTGSPMDAETLAFLPSQRLRNACLRMSCYALKDNVQGSKTRTYEKPIAPHAEASAVERALKALPESSLLASQGDYTVHVFKGSEQEFLLSEIGVAREETFRPCDEGSGKERDLDEYDPHYYHLLLWNEKDRAIAGAYRLGKVGEILETQGVQGLYSSTLFQMDENFLATCGREGLELGRALVTAPYQRDFYPLLLLWKGIATFIYRHNLRHLFGPASLSLAASGASLELITTLLASQYASESLEGHIQGRNTPSFGKPDRARAMILAAIERGEIDFRCVDRIVRGLDMGRGIPVLFRHYLQLNGKIAAFHEDKDFNSLDAFLFVDLPKAPKAKLRRYMGDEAAKDYLARMAA